MSCFYRVLYYVHEKLPKKCHELKDIVDDLKQCLTETEMLKKGGTRPLRASGTRFIAHKVSALARLVDRYGWSLPWSLDCTLTGCYGPII